MVLPLEIPFLTQNTRDECLDLQYTERRGGAGNLARPIAQAKSSALLVYKDNLRDNAIFVKDGRTVLKKGHDRDVWC